MNKGNESPAELVSLLRRLYNNPLLHTDRHPVTSKYLFSVHIQKANYFYEFSLKIFSRYLTCNPLTFTVVNFYVNEKNSSLHCSTRLRAKGGDYFRGLEIILIKII